MGNGEDAFFDGLPKLLFLHKAAHHGNVAAALDEGGGPVSAAGFFDGDGQVRVDFLEDLGEGVNKGAHGRRAVNLKGFFIRCGRQEPADEQQSEGKSKSFLPLLTGVHRSSFPNRFLHWFG